MTIPNTIAAQAITQWGFDYKRIDIYQLQSGTFVIVPHGYVIPNNARLVGYVQDGKLNTENLDRVQER